MKTKFIASILIIVMVVTLFAACSRKTADTTLKINRLHSNADSNEPYGTNEVEDAESRVRDLEIEANETTNPNTTSEATSPTETEKPTTTEVAGSNAPTPKPTEPPVLPDNEFTELMPLIRITLHGVVDNQYGTTAIYASISRADFNGLGRTVRERGFYKNVVVDNLVFTAQNEDGYFIKIAVNQQSTKISIYKDEKHFS